MIELRNIKDLRDKLGVSEQVVLMEAYQMLILNDLSELPMAKWLVFKGGTCLKLAFNAYRFSEDLDFSMLKTIRFTDFKKSIEQIVERYSELKIDEVVDMNQTLFARLIAIHGSYRIGIKVEVSKRKESWMKDIDYELRVLDSKVSNLKPLWKVSTLKKVYADKVQAVKSRKKPRDWFDLWFLSQLLGVKWNSKVNVSDKLMKDRVRFLLPKNKRNILKEFEYASN